MIAFATFRTSDGERYDVPHGGIVGRLGVAALPLHDARVSEAHALVSLRGGLLRLLSLRGRFAVDGRPRTELTLAPGQRVHFARDLVVTVEAVHVPANVPGLRVAGLPEQVLAGVTSLLTTPKPALVGGFRDGAAAVFWNRDTSWVVRLGDMERALVVGETFDVAGLSVEVVRVPVAQAGPGVTRQADRIAAPLHIVAAYDTVQIFREGVLQLTLGGKLARLVSELVAFDGPVAWAVLAGEVWRGMPAHKLRRNLDQTLLRLRKKLEAAGIRTNLVQSDGAGSLELLRLPGDSVADRS